MKTSKTTDNLLLVGMLGAAGFLVYKAFGLGSSKGGTVSGTSYPAFYSNSYTPAKGSSYNPVNPGQFTWTKDLLNGAVTDYYSGNNPMNQIPMIGDIFKDVIRNGL
jgi:hypothetical protein